MEIADNNDYNDMKQTKKKNTKQLQVSPIQPQPKEQQKIEPQEREINESPALKSSPSYHYDDNIPLYNYGRASANKFAKLGVDPSKDFRTLKQLYPSFRELRQALMRKDLFLSKNAKDVFRNLYDKNAYQDKTNNVAEPSLLNQCADSGANDAVNLITQNTASALSVAPEFFQKPQQKSLTSHVANQIIQSEKQYINGPQTSTVLPQDLRVASRGLPQFSPNELTIEANRIDDTKHINNIIPVPETNFTSDEIIDIAINNAEQHPTIIDASSGKNELMRHRNDENNSFLMSRMQPLMTGTSTQSATDSMKDPDTFWNDYLPFNEQDFQISKISHNRTEEIERKHWLHLNDKNHRIDYSNPLELAHLAQKKVLFHNVHLTSPLPPNFRGAEINEQCKMYGSYLADPFGIATNRIQSEENLIRQAVQNQLSSKQFLTEEWALKNINAARGASMPAHISKFSYEPGRWIVSYPPPGIIDTSDLLQASS